MQEQCRHHGNDGAKAASHKGLAPVLDSARSEQNDGHRSDVVENVFQARDEPSFGHFSARQLSTYGARRRVEYGHEVGAEHEVERDAPPCEHPGDPLPAEESQRDDHREQKRHPEHGWQTELGFEQAARRRSYYGEHQQHQRNEQDLVEKPEAPEQHAKEGPVVVGTVCAREFERKRENDRNAHRGNRNPCDTAKETEAREVLHHLTPRTVAAAHHHRLKNGTGYEIDL